MTRFRDFYELCQNAEARSAVQSLVDAPLVQSPAMAHRLALADKGAGTAQLNQYDCYLLAGTRTPQMGMVEEVLATMPSQQRGVPKPCFVAEVASVDIQHHIQARQRMSPIGLREISGYKRLSEQGQDWPGGLLVAMPHGMMGELLQQAGQNDITPQKSHAGGRGR